MALYVIWSVALITWMKFRQKLSEAGDLGLTLRYYVMWMTNI